MGAAAFVMASFIGVTYFEVVKHAFLPAIISYIALFYISHLEALKLNLKGMNDKEVPNLKNIDHHQQFLKAHQIKQIKI